MIMQGAVGLNVVTFVRMARAIATVIMTIMARSRRTIKQTNTEVSHLVVMVIMKIRMGSWGIFTV